MLWVQRFWLRLQTLGTLRCDARRGTEVRMRKASWPKHEMPAWRPHDRIARRLVSRPSPGVRVFELRQRDRA